MADAWSSAEWRGRCWVTDARRLVMGRSNLSTTSGFPRRRQGVLLIGKPSRWFSARGLHSGLMSLLHCVEARGAVVLGGNCPAAQLAFAVTGGLRASAFSGQRDSLSQAWDLGAPWRGGQEAPEAKGGQLSGRATSPGAWALLTLTEAAPGRVHCRHVHTGQDNTPL